MGDAKRFRGLREIVWAVAGLTIVAAVLWSIDSRSCATLDEDQDQVGSRDSALLVELDERCKRGGASPHECVAVGVQQCRAKVRVRERRSDEHGEALGTFETTLAMRYSPLLGQWFEVEVLDRKQILGLPNRE